MSEPRVNPYELPADLPVPENDGGADHLPDARVPSVSLPATDGGRVDAGELTDLGASVIGLSAQLLAEQREFATRERLPYPLLNDSGFRLAEDLGLPTFEAYGVRYYRRLTFIARRGRIAKVFYPVFPPQNNADDVVAWLRSCRR